MNFTSILDFLEQLQNNNNREWMENHKPVYLAAKKEFEVIVSDLILGVSQWEKGVSTLKPKDCIFRIHRDIRFSKDKTPYKNNFGAAINQGGKKSSSATYYLHVQPSATFIAGGVYMPTSINLNNIRQEIDYNPEEFRKIIESPDFKKYFGSMEGDKLKRAPKGYNPDDPNIEWLKHKSYLMVHKVTDKKVRSKSFSSYVLEVFEKMKPLNDFLNRAMDQDFLK